MSNFAVRIDVLQTLLTQTEVVVDAAGPAEAIRLAKSELASVLPTSFGPSVLTEESMEIGELRQIDNPDNDPIPYVYDLLGNRAFTPEGVENIFPAQPDLKSDPHADEEPGLATVDLEPSSAVDFWEAPVHLIVTEPLEKLEVPANSAVAFQGPKTTSDGTPQTYQHSFDSRPTAGIERPKTTLPNGYTPLDHEYRDHAVFPYYLGGPACIELAQAEYCGATGISQRTAAATCPAPKTWTEPTAPAAPPVASFDEDEDEDDEYDWNDEDHYWDD